MAKNLILTCDMGTKGCKCAVFDAQGRMIVSSQRGYPTQYPQPNWSEQDPDVILEKVIEGIRELLIQVSPREIACIGLSGTMNGCIPVDEKGKVLYPNIIHSDSRTEAQVEEILQIIPANDFYRLTGNRADCHYTLPKILWLRENCPEIYEKARWFLNIKDYIYAHMTGRIGYTDYSDASLTIALDINRRCWADGMLKDLRLDPSRMPRLLVSQDTHGKTTRDFYNATGIITGTPVAIGGGDGACTGRGAGIDAEGSAYTYIGSTAWVSLVSDKPVFDEKARIFNYLDLDGHKVNVTGTVQCGVAAFDWAQNNFLGREGKHANTWETENLARQIAPGAEGVLFLPTLMGWRTPYWDPNTRGCLMGLSLHHDRRHIARAVYEGIAFALNSCASVMKECGKEISSMMLTGEGARSGLWPDMLASIYGVKTMVHKTPGETASLGAAIAAGVGVGLFESYAKASDLVSVRSTHTPNDGWQTVYQEIYDIYADIYDRVKPLNDRIAEL